MSVRSSSEPPSYCDKDELLQGHSEVEIETPARPSSRKIISTLITLFVCVSLWILSTITLEHKSQHPFNIPIPPPPVVCEHATSRPSWHDLPLHRRHAYVRAVQRLSTLPSRLGLNTSRYDDFTYVHIQLVWQVHHVAVSLPFHRYFVSVFEHALREEGGYDGLMPYWDWTLDADSPLESSIWDGWAGFGAGHEGCVTDGVFGRVGKLVNYTEHGYQPHCLARTLNSTEEDGIMHSKHWNTESIEKIQKTSTTYNDFRTRLEDGPHRHLHWGIGGEMPTASSTNDPLFFLHHAQIDRLWWLWQQQNPTTRNIEYSGPVRQSRDESAQSGAKTSDTIQMLGLAPDISVQDIMNTKNELICYKYKIDH